MWLAAVFGGGGDGAPAGPGPGGGVDGWIALAVALGGPPAVPPVLVAPLVGVGGALVVLAPAPAISDALVVGGGPAPLILVAPITAAVPPLVDSDVRIHPPLVKILGGRTIDFQVAVERFRPIIWPGSPIKGCCAIGWLLTLYSKAWR